MSSLATRVLRLDLRGKLPPRHAPSDFTTPVETSAPPVFQEAFHLHRFTRIAVNDARLLSFYAMCPLSAICRAAPADMRCSFRHLRRPRPSTGLRRGAAVTVADKDMRRRNPGQRQPIRQLDQVTCKAGAKALCFSPESDSLVLAIATGGTWGQNMGGTPLVTQKSH